MPDPCPRGTYQPHTGMTNISDCIACAAGFYCPLLNMTSTTAFPCDPGHYCLPGMDVGSPEDSVCPIGSHCPGGSAGPEPCAPGYYQDEMRQSACKQCLDGFYCPGTVAGISEPNGTVYCTLGHFCRAGRLSVPISCPPGMFANHTGKKECDVCPPGYTCPKPAMIFPFSCPAGRFCGYNNSGAVLPIL